MLTGQEPEDLPHRGLGIDVRAAVGAHASNQLTGILEKMLDPDPDRRASRLSQILARAQPARVDVSRRARSNVRVEAPADPHQIGMKEFFRSAAKHANRRERKHAEREARRDEKRARRAERFERRGNAYGPPWPIPFLLSLGISIGIFFVVLATQIVVPLFLVFLSVIFARQALQSAAHRVRLAGRGAIENMNRSRSWLVGDFAPDEKTEHAHDARPPLRVDEPATRARVEVADDHDDDENADAASERRTRKH
jgi:hypothetical protein